jgi:3-deoxy-D-manno-octulosonate 8-phosphate phosphatase (KDO 8-P phosphatase)
LETRDSILVPGDVIHSEIALRDKLHHIKAILFDWDGIFNSGEKGHIPSTFNEIDSMGINMLRFGYYLLHGENPITGIVTGEKNETAIKWSEREHLHAVYLKVKHKADILESFQLEYGIQPREILFVFDDIHDLSLAKETGCGMLVRNEGARMFSRYCTEHKLCDYVTKNTGGSHALREISEVVLGLLGLFSKTVENRMEFSGIYKDYLQMRNLVKTNIRELKY